MNKEVYKQFIAEIPDYLEGKLSPERRVQFEHCVDYFPECKSELEAYKKLVHNLKKENPVPTDRLRANFEEALKLEKSKEAKVVPLEPKRNNWATNFLKIAASVALLIASYQTGRIMQMEKSNQDLAGLLEQSKLDKQMAMLSLMENQSASKRIQGVSFISEFPNPDQEIMAALAERLLQDENDIVRYNAFEALAEFTTTDFVKEVFIKSLKKEKNPSIQIGIIQSLTKIQEKKAIGPMQQLLEQEDTQPFVKNEIELALPKII
ncbi:HEAT repeat domain-containing protein [Muricauda sp. 2012CJ35-5]|uniref:HEAT repeat domain-containing protein n=1 Tax=Flagellimonas spongiicola TaxID=2942208 RepID=A0ABT0PU36_9FLAO|nr:HEAT repeat domain-containing protein [Allomuricauda spongiicola]MCL6274496.1 HEAT repeat domain-containing protein [Allomuricauda spongiicola]